MNFKAFGVSVLAILGINAFEKKDDKSVITEDQRKKLVDLGFSDKFLEGFEQALASDFKEEGKEKESDQSNREAVLSGLLAQTTSQLAEAQAQLKLKTEELSTETKDKASLEGEVATLKTSVTDLKAKLKIISNESEEDHKSDKGNSNQMKANYKDDKQLGGFTGQMFSLDRPYNQRARAQLLYYSEGISVMVPEASSIDYNALKEDLGEFYRIPWSERLQTFLEVLPSISSIFGEPLSGYQDRAVLTNLFLGEFSQPENSSSDFDKVAKGSFEFDPEELRMFGVMFAHRFKDLKQIEQNWIGYMNNEGSQAIKMSLISYLLVEVAKKLHNEREQRNINGVRKNATLNEPGLAMDAADGLYEFLRKKIDGWKDNNGTTIYQIKPFVLGEITPSNIGEKIYNGTSMVPAVVRDSGNLVLHMPSFMIPWLDKYYETMYGQNTDYKGSIRYVKEYPSVKIKEVPNADNHHRIFWTLDGNIKNFEHVKGEMFKFSLEQSDWSLKVWSQWKESTWAYKVGKRSKDKAEMSYDNQLIFCNEYDMPATAFIKMRKDDATPSALIHKSLESVVNTNITAITDILDLQTGEKVILRCGATDSVKIVKSDKFSLISADWVPKAGETITLLKRADGKYIEVQRKTTQGEVYEFEANDTTPSVGVGSVFMTGANTGATAITSFMDAIEGKEFLIHGNGSTNASTIANSGAFFLTAAATLSTGKWIKLVKVGDKFFEIDRG